VALSRREVVSKRQDLPLESEYAMQDRDSTSLSDCETKRPSLQRFCRSGMKRGE